MSNESDPRFLLPCRYLRSKEMYYDDDSQDDDAMASGLYWCTKTQEGFGPDGQPAAKKDCCAGRSCYIN